MDKMFWPVFWVSALFLLFLLLSAVTCMADNSIFASIGYLSEYEWINVFQIYILFTVLYLFVISNVIAFRKQQYKTFGFTTILFIAFEVVINFYYYIYRDKFQPGEALSGNVMNFILAAVLIILVLAVSLANTAALKKLNRNRNAVNKLRNMINRN